MSDKTPPIYDPTADTQTGTDTSARPAETGAGGELHQRPGDGPRLTTAQGIPVADNQNSLRAGARGPTLLQDFVLREKLFHFDHERIPERVVHARGYGAHGYFETTESLADLTAADLFQEKGTRTPVFVRFSTVVGNKGSADMVRDVRGFSVKMYTEQGNWDLVSNNIPVFFIQDPIKFPDLVHSIKEEPDRAFPQAQSAHDNFFDFVSLMPESMHMMMWLMSDRTIPRSFRFMEGFGVHTFRLINSEGKSSFVKFHWKPRLGMQSVLWDEAVKINGADPDFHRRDLWDSIEAGDFPEWDLALQVFDDDFADRFEFDILDPTKLIPEEVVPLKVVGRLVLNRMVDNFFSETEQVAFCPQNVVPGIDFSNDPLLQGRLFSYLDTQLKRLGSPNFTHLPINAPRCPMHHFQQDGHMQTRGPKGRANYEPNSWSQGGPRPDLAAGHRTFPTAVQGDTRRQRPESFADHYSQARQFYISQTPIEQKHIADALIFELAKVETQAIRERMVAHLPNIDTGLAQSVARGLGMGAVPTAHEPAVAPRGDLPPSDPLSILKSARGTFKGRKMGVLMTDGIVDDLLEALIASVKSAGGMVELIAMAVGGIVTAQGKQVMARQMIDGAPSVLYDSVAVLATEAGAQALAQHHPARTFAADAVAHGKFLGVTDEAWPLFRAAGIDGQDEGFHMLDSPDSIEIFLEACRDLRFWDRIAA
jgi:catalase